MTATEWHRKLCGYDMEPMLEINPFSDVSYWYQELLAMRGSRLLNDVILSDITQPGRAWK